MTAAESASPTKTETAPAAPAEPTQAAAPVASSETPAAGRPVDVRNLQDKFNSLIEQRNQTNDLARAAAEARNQLNEQRRVKSQELEAHKAARDAANEVMRTHRAARDAYQDQAKQLIAQKKGKTGSIDRSLQMTVRKLQNDIAAMVEQQQTAVLSPSKEKVLVEKIRDMFLELKAKEGELKAQKTVEIDLSDTDGTIDGYFAKADEEHAKVVAALKEAQGHHDKFIAGVKEVRVLVQEANKKHAEFVACKEKADECHNKAMELREKVMAVRGEKKAEYDAQRKEIQAVNQTARKNVADPRALDRIKDDALEQLKKGGKISLGF
jgi:uncharacterized coiled-coil DUF342 family protein